MCHPIILSQVLGRMHFVNLIQLPFVGVVRRCSRLESNVKSVQTGNWDVGNCGNRSSTMWPTSVIRIHSLRQTASPYHQLILGRARGITVQTTLTRKSTSL